LNDIKSLDGEVVSKNSIVQKRDAHAEKQKKTLNFLGIPDGGALSPSPTILDMVIEEVCTTLAP